MASRCARPAFAAVTATALLMLSTAASASAAPLARGETIDDSYIVVYKRAVSNPSAETRARERRLDFKAGRRFKRALEGFAATLTREQLRNLRSDPEVDFVAPNRRVQATAYVPLTAGDSTPFGVRRMLAGTATTARQASAANVAVIDTGIDLDHPDLNAANGTNCINPGTRPRTTRVTGRTWPARSVRATTAPASWVSPRHEDLRGEGAQLLGLGDHRLRDLRDRLGHREPHEPRDQGGEHEPRRLGRSAGSLRLHQRR